MTVDADMSEEAAREKLESDLKMPGMMLNDSAIVKRIDSDQQFIKAKLNNDGSLSKTTNAKSAAEIERLLQYVREIFQNIGEKILGGEIAARPFKKDGEQNGCRYCEYKAVCGFDPDSKNWLYVPNWNDAEALKHIDKKLAGGERIE